MRTTKLLLTSLVLSVPVFASATAYKFVAADNSLATRICVHAGENRLGKVRMDIKKADLRQRYVANVFKCNDMSVAQFAYKFEADRTSSFLDRFSRLENKSPQTRVIIKNISMNQSQGDSVDDDVKVIYVAATQ